jgi:hypothetical protein
MKNKGNFFNNMEPFGIRLLAFRMMVKRARQRGKKLIEAGVKPSRRDPLLPFVTE